MTGLTNTVILCGVSNMHNYRFRVYLKAVGFMDVNFACRTPGEGEAALKAQYGCNVTWLGNAK